VRFENIEKKEIPW